MDGSLEEEKAITLPPTIRYVIILLTTLFWLHFSNKRLSGKSIIFPCFEVIPKELQLFANRDDTNISFRGYAAHGIPNPQHIGLLTFYLSLVSLPFCIDLIQQHARHQNSVVVNNANLLKQLVSNWSFSMFSLL